MKDLNNKLDHRNKQRIRKPAFSRQDSNKKKTLGSMWKKPKGIHSKMRLKKRGYKRSPSIGYSAPKDVRCKSRDGKEIIKVYNLKDLKDLKENSLISIGSSVGTRNKIQILKEAKQKKILVHNYKDTEKKIKNIEEDIKNRQELKKKKTVKEKIESKSQSKPVKEKKQEESKDKPAKEEKPKQEKKEKVKNATQKPKETSS